MIDLQHTQDDLLTLISCGTGRVSLFLFLLRSCIDQHGRKGGRGGKDELKDTGAAHEQVDGQM